MADLLSNINWELIAPILVIQLLLMVVALFDWFRMKTTNGPKWLWLFIILFVSTLGPILYFIFGRRNN